MNAEDRVTRIITVSEFGDGTFDVMDNDLRTAPARRRFEAKQLDAKTVLRAIAERLDLPDPVTGRLGIGRQDPRRRRFGRRDRV